MLGLVCTEIILFFPPENVRLIDIDNNLNIQGEKRREEEKLKTQIKACRILCPNPRISANTGAH